MTRLRLTREFTLACELTLAMLALTARGSSNDEPSIEQTSTNGPSTPASSPSPSRVFSVPASRVETKVLATLKKTIPTAKFINTQWNPANGYRKVYIAQMDESSAYLNYQKDSSTGTFIGKYENEILNGIYSFRSAGFVRHTDCTIP
ncbi:MAG: hypothetical protein HY050_05725 [Actinobacteria bacterium]|nr:hypothetical protein [Actinomycetota bacterium]